ncbi:MAG: GspE/PulE family protein, partial [Planctomycetota bacterium]
MAKRKPIGQILKEMELVTEGDIQEALQIQRENGGALGQILVDMEVCTGEDILFALAAQSGMDVIDLEGLEIPKNAIGKVNAAQAHTYKIIPVEFSGGVLKVCLADPSNIMIFEELRFTLGCEVIGVVATEDQIEAALGKYYGEDNTGIGGMFGGDDLDDEGLAQAVDGKKSMDISDAAANANAPAVVKLLNMILMHAIRDKAADVHLEPYEDAFRVRYRVDGVLYEMDPPPRELAPVLTARVKVMSNLDIAETRLPQDGRIELSIGGKPIDLRVSTLPTMYGESCVMRILDRSVVSLDLDNLGMAEAEKMAICRLVDKPNGIMLVTGPTGSGKTTTLYSCLNYANDIGIKIITTEDPVEYDLEGIIQCQINEDVGLTYAAALRAILRQDPDKILVGEIRDKETAGIAVEAALTGHLVLSTLHTNDAPTVITRMVDIGVEDFLLAATIEGIVAQRLVRKVCMECRELYEPTEEQMQALNLKANAVAGKTFAYGKGCASCNFTGHRGRMAIYEIMLISDRLR